MTLAALVAGLWGCPTPPATSADDALHVFAEGPCAKLTVAAAGPRRFVIYGDTGYDLRGWLPGDRVAAAQAIVEVHDGRAFFNEAFSTGLPSDNRGYVRGSLTLGGDFESGVWLLVGSARYARGGTGALFERDAQGYLFDRNTWKRSDEPVALPARARQLPELPSDACGELTFVPLAWDATPDGGIVVAGRCDDDAVTNPHDPTVVALHGRQDATTWNRFVVPNTDALDGIVNLDVAARGDDDIYLVAYAPFRERDDRQSFIAHFDGGAWRELDWVLDGGSMSVAVDRNDVYVAAGRALYRHRRGTLKPVALDRLQFAEIDVSQRHIHSVHAWGGELWAEASYRVNVPAAGGRHQTVWASALYTRAAPRVPYYCDAREEAAEAFYEVTP